MLRRTQFPTPGRGQRRQHVLAATTIVLAITLAAIPFNAALALITGGEGNSPVTDPGWPKGAAAIFNNSSRIAWWVGPPFGGGQWHAECRGDTKVFNAVLADFAKLDVKTRRLVVHDGVGQSYWLNINREPARQAAARMDWAFMVWQPESWERDRSGPPAQIDVYTGGNVRWDDVKVPAGIEVIDQRLEAHGHSLTDGIVLEGRVTDLATQQPIAARVRLERVEPQPNGSNKYTSVAQTAADPQGHWVLKKVSVGWHRVVVEADGYVPRDVGNEMFDDQPRWQFYDGKLVRPGPVGAVAGRIVDDAGQPLADVVVRLTEIKVEGEGRYTSPQEYTSTTDANGLFRLDQVPVGTATILVRKSGYCPPRSGKKITTPKEDVALSMIKAARVNVVVAFATTARPAGYLVHIEPEGGAAIGKWSGSGNIDATNQVSFENVPPGKYVLQGQPNPGREDERSLPITVDLKGGQTIDITLPAK